MNVLKDSSCYLAGPIDKASDYGKGWRNSITPFLKELGVKIFNPCDKPSHLLNESAESVQHRNRLKLCGKFDEVSKLVKEIRNIDLRMVDMCDFLIVHLDNNIRTCGTWEELFTANRNKKPILVHIEQGKVNVPDWLLGTIPHEFIFSRWQDLKNYLVEANIGNKIWIIQSIERFIMNNVGMGGRVYGLENIATKSGASMAKFRLQMPRYKKDAFYIDVISFDKNADFVNQHVKEGSGVFVSGKLDEDSWEKDGTKQRRLKIIADRVEFLPINQKKQESGNSETDDSSVPIETDSEASDSANNIF